MRECLIEKFRTDLLTGHKPAQEDITARNYLDLARLDWLQPEVQKVADWIEQQAAGRSCEERGADARGGGRLASRTALTVAGCECGTARCPPRPTPESSRPTLLVSA